MRHFFKQFLNITALVAVASAQLVIPQVVLDQANDQQIVMPDPASDEFASSPPMLSDQLSLEPQASIFFSYARESAKLSGIMSGVGEYGGSHKYTVFVPTNRAVMALARKPHLGREPVDGSIEISDEEADRQAQENVEKWVSAHIVPKSLELSAGMPEEYPTLLDGISLTLIRENSHKSPEYHNWRLNGNVAILGQRKAANGVMYLIDGTIEV